MDIKQVYWNYFTNMKFTIDYWTEYYNASYRWSRRLDCALAIASSSSIAAWAIWNWIPYLWAAIIALSQVIFVIKPYLPYIKRMNAIYEVLPKLNELFDRIDYNWFKVANDEITPSDVNKLLYHFKTEYTVIENKLNGTYFPKNERFRDKAQVNTEEYFKILS